MLEIASRTEVRSTATEPSELRIQREWTRLHWATLAAAEQAPSSCAQRVVRGCSNCSRSGHMLLVLHRGCNNVSMIHVVVWLIDSLLQHALDRFSHVVGEVQGGVLREDHVDLDRQVVTNVVALDVGNLDDRVEARNEVQDARVLIRRCNFAGH